MGEVLIHKDLKVPGDLTKLWGRAFRAGAAAVPGPQGASA